MIPKFFQKFVASAAPVATLAVAAAPVATRAVAAAPVATLAVAAAPVATRAVAAASVATLAVADVTKSAPMPDRCEPMHIDANQCDCELEYRPPAEHARMLLEWLHQADGRVGWFRWHELETIYREMAIERRLEPHSWVAIARPLGKLIPQVRRLDRERVRMWNIPPASAVVRSFEPMKRRHTG